MATNEHSGEKEWYLQNFGVYVERASTPLKPDMETWAVTERKGTHVQDFVHFTCSPSVKLVWERFVGVVERAREVGVVT